MRIPTKELNEMKERLSAEVIDDSEEIAEWMAFNGVELINEVLEYRTWTDTWARENKK